MSKRRYSSRLKSSRNFHFDSDESDNEPIPKLHKRKSAVKTKRTVRKHLAKEDSLSVITKQTTEKKPETSSGIDLQLLEQNIEKKIDSIFRSSNLISDDEEDDIPIPKAQQTNLDTFYTLSDSDDDGPSTSGYNLTNNLPVLSPVATGSGEQDNYNSNNDLVEIVDEILDCNDVSVQIASEPDKSWDDFKKKYNEILGTVSATLEDVSKNVKPVNKLEQDKSNSSEIKLSCPICLEKFDGNITAATTTCGHIFCHPCILQVAKSSKKCPTCRKNINAKKIHALYL